MQHNVGSSPGGDGMQGAPRKVPFSVDIPHCRAVAKEGSLQYEHIVEKLLNTNATDEVQPVTVTSVSGESGSGKTSTCVLALQDPRVTAKYRDGVFGFEIGLVAREKDIVRKIARIVDDCDGDSVSQSIRSLARLEEAAEEALRFFSGRKILLFLDNVWPDTRCLKGLISIASGAGSCVLFSTQSTALAQDYSDCVVEIGTLRLEVPVERAAAEAIFYTHFRPRRDHSWFPETVVNEALSLSRGLPITIATLAALVRKKLACRVTIRLLGPVAENRRSLSRWFTENLKHQRLFAAMGESLMFLDQQYSAMKNVGNRSRRLMTRRYASLHELDMSEHRINASILSILWNTSLRDAETTVREFFSLGLVTLAPPGAVSSANDNERSCLETLTLHNLQVEYSMHVACYDDVPTATRHETALRGMFEGNIDIDALSPEDFVKRCEVLCQTKTAGVYRTGRFVISNLLHHLVGSLTLYNRWSRWRMILNLLLDARWLLMWQRVDGWAFVCDRYVKLWNALSHSVGPCLISIEREVEAVAELGLVGQRIKDAPISWCGEDEEKKAAVEMYVRLHASWLECGDTVLQHTFQHALGSLCVVAGRWWMRPVVACREPHVPDRRLRRILTMWPHVIVGCALIGSHGHVVTGTLEDGVVVHDGSGAVVAKHNAHLESVRGVCVGCMGGDTEYRVLSVGSDGSLVRWDLSLPADAVGRVHAAAPAIVDTIEEHFNAVACSDDASIVAAAAGDVVYAWRAVGVEGRYRRVRRAQSRGHEDQVYCVAVSSDGTTVLSGSDDGTCRVWAVIDALRSGKRLLLRAVLEGGPRKIHSVYSCAFACEDHVAVIGYGSGAVGFWSLADATLLGEVDLQSGSVNSLAAIGRTGDEVVAGTARGTAHVVRVSDRAVATRFGRNNRDGVMAVYASRDDRRLVLCGHMRRQVKIWGPEPGTGSQPHDIWSNGERSEPPRHLDSVNTICTSSCGGLVVSGGRDKTVRCWRAGTGRELWKFECRSAVNCVCMWADAAHVACGCEDGTVHVLDMANGKVVCSWKHDNEVSSVCVQEQSENPVRAEHANGGAVVQGLGNNSPAHRTQGSHENDVESLGEAADGRNLYSGNQTSRTVPLKVSGDIGSSTTLVRDQQEGTRRLCRGDAFSEHPAQTFVGPRLTKPHEGLDKNSLCRTLE